MPFRLVASLVLCFAAWQSWGASAPTAIDFKAPLHGYYEKSLHDPVSRFLERLQHGQVKLDTSGNLPFLLSILKELKVPVHSQMLVFSATSFQSGLIHPSNPRALYFNEDTYVGFVPGGRIEMIGIDPELGAIFYIFSPLSSGGVPAVERSNRCMNCHAGAATEHLPGLVAESVAASVAGASLETYRHDETGHQIPLDQRFGGWHLTGGHHLASHHGNILAQGTPQGMLTQVILPGEMSDLRRYPASTSDILPQLVHEHQLGFVDRVLKATYLIRTLQAKHPGRPDAQDSAALEDEAKSLTHYLLFADEARLPSQGIEGDPAFVEEFLQARKADSTGQSLRDLDLKTHMFRNRCSYMIYTAQWAALPVDFRERVYRQMAYALRDEGALPEYAYLSGEEKHRIRGILKDTLPGMPAWWKK